MKSSMTPEVVPSILPYIKVWDVIMSVLRMSVENVIQRLRAIGN